MKPDGTPLRRMEEILKEMTGCSDFTRLDLCSGYWQTPAAKHCNEMTKWWQRIWTVQFSGVHLDNIAIFSKKYPDHTEQVMTILEQISSAGLCLKLNKSKFLCDKGQRLDQIFLKEGINVDFDKIWGNVDAPTQQSEMELCIFLVLASY